MLLRREMLLAKDKILPSEYRQVEYIECTGTQYIETNFVLEADNAEIEWTYMLTQTQSGDSMMFGCREGKSIRLIYAEVYNGARWYCASGSAVFENVLGQSYQNDAGRILNKKYQAKMDDEYLSVNGFSASKTSTLTGQLTTPLCIFARKTKNTIDYINKGMRLYDLNIKEDGVLTANFIPCYRKSDGEIGLYDTIAKSFYSNTGTGELIKGRNV